MVELKFIVLFELCTYSCSKMVYSWNFTHMGPYTNTNTNKPLIWNCWKCWIELSSFHTLFVSTLFRIWICNIIFTYFLSLMWRIKLWIATIKKEKKLWLLLLCTNRAFPMENLWFKCIQIWLKSNFPNKFIPFPWT